MPHYIFDTDHLTLYLHKQPSVMRRLAACALGDVALNPVTVEETLKGRLAKLSQRLTGHQRIQAYENLVDAVKICNRFPILAFDQASESMFQNLKTRYPRLGSQDLKIAAVALVNHLTLLTANRRDFGQIGGLAIDDWSI